MRSALRDLWQHHHASQKPALTRRAEITDDTAARRSGLFVRWEETFARKTIFSIGEPLPS
jgi:hypothetical protein